MVDPKDIASAISELSSNGDYAYITLDESNPQAPFQVRSSSYLGRCWRCILIAFLKFITCGCYKQHSLDNVVLKLDEIGAETLTAAAKHCPAESVKELVRRLEKRSCHSPVQDVYQRVIGNLTSWLQSEHAAARDDLISSLQELEKTHPVPPIGDPTLINSQLHGGVFGQFAGDTFGVITEFMNKAHIKESLPEILEPGAILSHEMRQWRVDRKAHRFEHLQRFKANEWTDDSDQFMLILRALERQKKDLSLDLSLVMAQELHDWRASGLKARSKEGFKGRKKPECQGLGRLVGSVIAHKQFLNNPVQAAQDRWLKTQSAANGALMRTAAVALTKWRDFSSLIEHTKIFCKVTHADPRCIASCAAFVTAMALVLRGVRDFATIKENALAIGKKVLHEELLEYAVNGQLLPDWQKQNIGALGETLEKEIEEYCNADSWEFLQLDEGYDGSEKQNKIGYTYKCMGAAFYCLKLVSEGVSFAEALRQLVAEGGDSDTNGCVAGALMGVFVGKDGIHKTMTEGYGSQKVIEQALTWVAI